MTFFVFIESEILSVPHMEPLVSDDLNAAKTEAEAVLGQHASGYAAHVFKGEERVATILKDHSGRAAFHRQDWAT